MIRMLVAAAAGLLLSAAVAADPAEFSTPAGADEVLEAKDLPFALRYHADHWSLQPQSSDFRLLARVLHKDSAISGAFVYRDEPASEDAVRERARGELDDAFAHHDVGFRERVVNGTPVLYMKGRATSADGTEVVIRNYYWSGPDGVADFSVLARPAVFEQHREAIMGLLNGLEIEGDATAG